MRRIAIGTTALALVAHLISCAADAPTAPKPGGGGSNNGALQIALYTNDSNPGAGACSLVQAIATLKGSNVPDGTGIAFSTDRGVFEQNGKPNISVVTTGGAATTAVCSASGGVAKVHASASVQGKSGSADISIAFQSSPSAGFVNSCSPTYGTPDGGTALTLSGGGFTGTAATTQVLFIAGGIARQALVQNVSSNQISVITPGFPELSGVSSPVQIQITFGYGTPSATTLTAPSCFVFSTAPASVPTISAVLPSSGKNEGNTRVAIVGSGFVAPLQVFFGPAEAQVLSISYSQIVALTPPATGIGLPNQNDSVDVRVHEVNSGADGTLADGFRYGPAMRLISFEGANIQQAGGPFTPLTIHGEGFDAPVKVGLAGFVASVLSVSATEIVVVPGNIVASGCGDIAGTITVTNINTGETAEGLSFTYQVVTPVITGISQSQAQVPVAGIQLIISGANFPTSAAGVKVTLGGQELHVVSASATALTVQVPATSAPAPTCGASDAPGTLLPAGAAQNVVVTNLATTCSATFSGAFTYLLPCVAAP